jgi:hypothetical protein
MGMTSTREKSAPNHFRPNQIKLSQIKYQTESNQIDRTGMTSTPEESARQKRAITTSSLAWFACPIELLWHLLKRAFI